MYLFEYLFSVLWGICRGVELQSHVVILYLIFWGANCKSIFHNAWTILHTHQKYTRISTSLYAPWHLLLSVLAYRHLSGCEIVSYCDLIWWLQRKNPPTNTGDVDSIPGSGWSPGEGNGNPHQYSCLGNPTNREEAGRLQSRGVAK